MWLHIRLHPDRISQPEVRLADLTALLEPSLLEAGRVCQVLINLLTNALRHTFAGSEIVTSGQAAVGEIYLALKDNGEGLEPNQAQAVFDHFYRGDKSRSRDTGSTGLGLAIVKAKITEHGGQVESTSQGRVKVCCFSLHLPV